MSKQEIYGQGKSFNQFLHEERALIYIGEGLIVTKGTVFDGKLTFNASDVKTLPTGSA